MDMDTQAYREALEARPPVVLSQVDRDRILNLASAAFGSHPAAAPMLLDEADRAVVLPPDEMPENVVAMHSHVEFRDESSGASRRVQIVYPDEANIAEGRVSVLTLIGAALIGLSEGQSILWPTQDNRNRRLTVLKVERSES